jgi:predicted phage terminase large subunit-like protein
MAISRADQEKRLTLLREKRIRLSRHELWEFCRTIDDDKFYSHENWHLKLNCWVLQALYERRLTKENFIKASYEICPNWFVKSNSFTELVDRLQDDFVYRKLMQNLPPRLGKSRTLVNFCKWVLGKDITNKIITASYNDDMAQTFSRYTRDGVEQPRAFPHDIVFEDVFPGTKLKEGNASYKEWALEGNFFNYKGAGVGGSVTGKGCNIQITDDPVKDASEAFNENRLETIWTWYTGTFMSRAEQDSIEIVNMTRWAKGDVCGRILSNETESKEWFIFLLEAYYEKEDQYLCPALLGEERYKQLKRNVEPSIFEANYHQKPVDVKGRLYQGFKTYDNLPHDEEGNLLIEGIIDYTDTADTGNDFLASIVAGVYKGQAYVLDVLYTKEAMETTEPQTAKLLFDNEVQIAYIESNNGGRAFARNVDRLLWENHKSRSTTIEWFHQSKNKQARILANSNNVQKNIYFPVNWATKWPLFYNALMNYQKEGKNKNDDAPDALTGLFEMIDGPKVRVRVL